MDKVRLVSLVGLSACLWAMAPAAFGEGSISEHLQGNWTTYRFRNQAGFAKVDLNVGPTAVEQEFQLMVFMPLFPGEGFDLRLTSEMTSTATETDPQGRSIHRLTTRLTAFGMRFNSVRETADRNRQAYCGVTDWIPGQYKDIAGKACVEGEDEEPVVQPAIGSPIEILVHADGAVMHTTLGLDDDEGDDLVIDWEHGLYRRPAP